MADYTALLKYIKMYAFSIYFRNAVITIIVLKKFLQKNYAIKFITN